MIAAHTIDAIRRQTDLPALVREYGVELRQRHGYQVGWCPWCEKPRTPALYVYADHSFCHRCSTYASAFDWVMRMEQVRFADAAEILASRAGIALNGKPLPRIANYADQEDRAMYPWWVRQRQKEARTWLDQLLIDGPPTDNETFSFAASVGRIAAHVPDLQEFKCLVTVADRKAWRGGVAEDKAIGEVLTALVMAAGPLATPRERLDPADWILKYCWDGDVANAERYASAGCVV